VVVSYHDTPSALKILQLVRSHARGSGDRAHDRRHDLERLRDAGATEVVPEAIEGSLMLAARRWRWSACDGAVIRLTRDARDARYHCCAAISTAPTMTRWKNARRPAGQRDPARRGLPGPPLADQALQAMGVNVVSVRQANGRVVDGDDALVLRAATRWCCRACPSRCREPKPGC